jgi:signal peptidase I
MNEDQATGDQALTNAQGNGSPVGDGDRGGPDPGITTGERGGPPDDGAGPGTAPRSGAASAASGSRPRPARKPRKAVAWWIELPALVVLALVLMLLIKSYAIQAFFIPSSSMENTLDIGDKVLVNKFIYHFRSIHRGDIIVFNGDGSWDPPAPAGPSNPVVASADRLGHAIVGLFGISPGVHDYIKRVIGVPGDRVACCDASGQVTVNGVALNEKSYLYPGNPPSLVRFSITVPPGRLWVMGDHRSVSYDSRGHRGDPGGGTIPESQVVGRAFVIMWPLSRSGILSIPSTFDQPKLTASAMAGGAGVAVPAGAALILPVGLLGRRARRRLRAARRPRPGRW